MEGMYNILYLLYKNKKKHCMILLNNYNINTINEHEMLLMNNIYNIKYNQ